MLDELCQSVFEIESLKSTLLELKSIPFGTTIKRAKKGKKLLNFFKEGYLDDILSKFVKDSTNKDIEQYLFYY